MNPPDRFHWSFYSFIPFTTTILFLDSKWVLANGFNGQILVNVLVPIYFLGMIFSMPDDRLRKIMWITVPVSGMGEIILSQGLELWLYKGGSVPLYVPFGHAIVVGSGFQLLWKKGIHEHASEIISGFLIGYGAMFLTVFLLAQDSFTLLLGLLYFLGVSCMKQRVIYMLMPVFVLFVEVVGTVFGCWFWPPDPLGVFSTTNPPAGSIMFYVYLDMIVILVGGSMAVRWRADRRSPGELDRHPS